MRRVMEEQWEWWFGKKQGGGGEKGHEGHQPKVQKGGEGAISVKWELVKRAVKHSIWSL